MAKIIINEEICKGCGLCTIACSKKLIVMATKFNKKGYHPAQFLSEESCSGCGLCYQVCPDVAIEVWK